MRFPSCKPPEQPSLLSFINFLLVPRRKILLAIAATSYRKAADPRSRVLPDARQQDLDVPPGFCNF